MSVWEWTMTRHCSGFMLKFPGESRHRAVKKMRRIVQEGGNPNEPHEDIDVDDCEGGALSTCEHAVLSTASADTITFPVPYMVYINGEP